VFARLPIGTDLQTRGPPISEGLDIEEYYRRAKEARRIADALGTTPAERADFIEIERSWMSLARRYATQGRD
jgi:hypothetical protein